MRAEMLVVVRQLGVCVRRVLRSEAVLHGAMDSDRGLELSASAELRNVPLRHSATFCEKWIHYTFLRKVESPAGSGAASPPPAFSGSSTRELNTWAGVSALPARPSGGLWTTLRVAHRLT